MVKIKSVKDRLIRGGIWAVIGKLSLALVGILSNALLARILSPEEMGVYFLAWNLAFLASVIAQQGVNTAVVKVIAEFQSASRTAESIGAIKSAFTLTALGTLVVGTGLLFAGTEIAQRLVESNLLAQSMLVIACWIGVMAFQSLTAETFRGLHLIAFASLFGGLLTNTLSVTAFAVIRIVDGTAPLDKILEISIISGFISTVIAVLVLRNKLQPRLVTVSKYENSRLLHLAWPLLFTSLNGIVLSQAAMWVLSSFNSEEDVGVFGATTRLATVIMQIVTLLYAFLPPLVAELFYSRDLDRLEKILRVGCTITFILTLPFVILNLFFPEWILRVIFGEAYVRGGFVLVLLTLGLLVNVVTGMRGYVLMMTGYEKNQFKLSLIGAVLNIIFCLYGAYYYGMTGVAIGAMSAMIAQCLLELLTVKKQIGIWTHMYVSPSKFISAYRSILSEEGKRNG